MNKPASLFGFLHMCHKTDKTEKSYEVSKLIGSRSFNRADRIVWRQTSGDLTLNLGNTHMHN